MDRLQRSIIATLAYFDLFDYPLTLTELWHNLWQSPAGVTITQVQTAVQQLPQVYQQAGVMMFRDRQSLVGVRAERYVESDRKFKKRLPYIQLLTYLPGVEAIFVVNSLAYYNANEHSDIDLLIITQPHHIWSTRFFTTTVAKVLGLRPKPNHTKDTLCLSFYVSASTLHLATLSTSGNDVHQAYWLSQFYPVYDPQQYTNRIVAANGWLKTLLPNTLPALPHPNRQIQPTWLHRLTQTLLGLLAWEKILQKIQLAILPAELKVLSQQPEHVVLLTPQILKFHTHDPRPELERRWRENIQRYSAEF